MDAADHGNLLDDGEDLILTDFHRGGIGIPIAHHSGDGAVAHHPIATRIVNDEEIRPAALDKFCADPAPGAGSDDRLAAREGVAETVEDFRSCVGVHGFGIGRTV